MDHDDLLAALDGAPEPEWEYGYRGMYSVMHPTKAGQRIETPESVITEALSSTGAPLMHSRVEEGVAAALRAANMLREPGVPDAPRRAVRELIAEARGFWGSETREYAEGLVSRLADALEAATRVPVHGEPNDGATQDRIAEIACTALGHRQGGDECMTDYAIADAILAEFPGFSRATVPDAATEELLRIARGDASRFEDEAVDAIAERDAALAAIERVRALETFSITDSYPAWTAVDHDDLLAALDGAPEPEWEYGYRGMYSVMHPTKAGQRIETPEITQRTPDNWLPEMGEIFRRRPSTPAGPWLLVEGESK